MKQAAEVYSLFCSSLSDLIFYFLSLHCWRNLSFRALELVLWRFIFIYLKKSPGIWTLYSSLCTVRCVLLDMNLLRSSALILDFFAGDDAGARRFLVSVVWNRYDSV